MMNTEMTSDTELAAWCDKLSAASEDAAAWVARNSDLVRNEKESLLKDLRKGGRLFRNCSKAAKRKMCAGVFGPSQAGKSYLISALARGESSRLDARFGDSIHEFLSEINPEGGKESTGLVTRFTMSETNAPKDFPVRLSLLSETDLVKILANTYYADCEHREDPRTNIPDALQELRSHATAPNKIVDNDAMEDLHEYIANEFRAKPLAQELERSYWVEAIELAPKLNLKDRVLLYSLIWDGVEEFTQLLEQLLKAIEELKNPEFLFASLDALLPREQSIIDVATLSRLEKPNADNLVSVRAPDGTTTNLPRATIAALTAELTISMAERPADYFDHTDLLDFPGYRSRYKLEDVRKELKKEGMLKELFLRGKVAYLFQRYCARHELNSMLLCIGPSNQEVQDLPSVINNWVASTHGELPEQRSARDISLFFILTKFDMEFEDKKGAPSLESRWDNRIHASLLDFFGKQHDWPVNWSGNEGFKNIFLLRNPNFRFEAIMDFDGDKETGIRQSRREYVEKLENAFLKSPLVKAHFHDPARAWEEAMRLNDGGISYIRECLSPVCDPALKRKQLYKNVEECRTALVNRLKGFYQPDDKDEMRNQKKRLILSLFGTLGQLETQRQRLGQLLRNFTMNDTDIYNLHSIALRRFRENARAEEEAVPAVAPIQEVDMENIDLLSFNPFQQSATKENALIEETKDEAETFAGLIESKWVEKIHTLADNAASQAYYMLSPELFSALASELAMGAERLGFRAKMADAFRKAAAYANTGQDSIARRQSAIAGRMLNDFVDWLGHHPHTEAPSERKVSLLGAKPVEVFTPQTPLTGLPVLAEQRSSYTQLWFQDWLNALAAMILDNINFNGQTTINITENTALGAILQEMREPA